MYIKKETNKFFIFTFLFFFIQNNFILTSILSRTQGIGFGFLRSILLPFCFAYPIIFITFSFLKKIFNNNFLEYKLDYSILKYLFYFTLLVLIRFIIDLLIDSKVDLIGLIPILEAIFLLFCLVYIFPEKNINISKKSISIFSYFIFLNIFFEIIIYFYDTFNLISYGPFRSYIAGITINRNPSFIFPILGLVVLIESDIKPLIKKIFSFLFFVYLIILFYRTLYVALFFVYILHLYNNKLFNFSIISLIKKLLLVIIGLYFLNNYFINSFNFDIFSLFLKRITSIFAEEENFEDAKAGRIVQIPLMIYEIIKNPFGMGFNGVLNSNPIYNYAYYHLQILMYLGWFIIPFIIIIYKKIIFNLLKNTQIRIWNYIIVYLSIIMIFFPYCSYFSITSLFIFSYYFSTKNFILNDN